MRLDLRFKTRKLTNPPLIFVHFVRFSSVPALGNTVLPSPPGLRDEAFRGKGSQSGSRCDLSEKYFGLMAPSLLSDKSRICRAVIVPKPWSSRASIWFWLKLAAVTCCSRLVMFEVTRFNLVPVTCTACSVAGRVGSDWKGLRDSFNFATLARSRNASELMLATLELVASRCWSCDRN